MSPEGRYQRWIEQHRRRMPCGIAERVMASIAEQNANQLWQQSFVSLLLAIGASRLGSCAVCCGALLVGMTPFLFMAYFARLIVF